MNPCPFDRQKNLTVPSLTSSSILPFMDTVLVRRVTMTSGNLRPGGTGDPGDIAMGDVMLIQQCKNHLARGEFYSTLLDVCVFRENAQFLFSYADTD